MSHDFQKKMRLLSHSGYVCTFDSILMYEEKHSFSGLLSVIHLWISWPGLLHVATEHAKWQKGHGRYLSEPFVVSLHNFSSLICGASREPFLSYHEIKCLLFRNFIKRLLLPITWLSQGILVNLWKFPLHLPCWLFLRMLPIYLS